MQDSKQVLIHHNWATNLALVLLYQLYVVLKPKATHTLSDSHTDQTNIVSFWEVSFMRKNNRQMIQLSLGIVI